MEKTRIALSLLMLVSVIALGSYVSIQTAQAAPECNCIDGFSKQAGIATWDSEQNRVRCAPVRCGDVVAVEDGAY